MARVLLISFFIVSTSLIAGGCGGDGDDSLRCVCNYSVDADGDGVDNTEFCLDMVCTGEGCDSCGCSIEEMEGEEVSSCNGTVAGSTTQVEDNVSAEITCYANNEAGTAICEDMTEKGIE